MRNRILELIVLALFVTGCATAPKEQPPELPAENQLIDTEVQPTYQAGAVRLFERANARRDNMDEARQLYLEAVAIDPAMEPAWFNLARLYYANAQYDALSELVKSDQLNGALSARILNLLAVSQKKAGQFNLAAESYQRALEIDENHLPSIANFAILTDIYLHNPQASLEWYEKYQIQLDVQGKEDSRVKNWIADVKQRISRLDGS